MFPFPFSFIAPAADIPVEQIANAEAMSFNGTDQYINSSPTLSGLTDITVSCWARFENINNNDFQYVLNAYNTTQSNAFRLGIAMIKSNFATTSDRYKLYTIDGPNLNISSFVVSQDVWYNIVVTQSGTERKLYVNGNLISTFTGIPALNLGNNFQIGRFQNSPHYFNGKIDEVAIFNTALSSDKIQQIYNATAVVGGVPQTANLFTGGLDTSLVYWNRMGDS